LKHKLVLSGSIGFGNRWMFVFFGIIIMMCLGTVYSWSVFRIPVENYYGISTMQSGFPYMGSLAFYALSMLITGRYLEKYSPRIILLIGGLLVGLGWMISGFAVNIFTLTISYGMILGIGVGIVYSVPMTVVARWFPEKKGLMVGLVLIGFGLSPLVTAPFASHLIERYGILLSFRILGVIFGVVIAVLSYTFRYPSEEDYSNFTIAANKGAVIEGLGTQDMIKSASFKGLYINFILGTMIGLTLIGMTSNIGIELIKLPSRTVALLMSVFAVFNGVGRPILGWTTDKLSHRKSMMLSFLSIIIAALLMLLAGEGSLGLFILSFSIFWFNLGGWLAIAPTTTLILYGTKHYSQNYGVVFTAYGIGAISGVLISGWLKQLHQGYHSLFYLIIVLSIGGIILTQKVFPRENRRSKA